MTLYLIKAGFRTLISFSLILDAKATAAAAGSVIYCSRLHLGFHFLPNPFLSGWEDKCSLGGEARAGFGGGGEPGYPLPSVRSRPAGGLAPRLHLMKLLSPYDSGSEPAEMGRGCGNRLPASVHPARRLEAGVGVSVPRRGRKRPQAPSAAGALRALSPPRPQPYPAHSVPFPENPTPDRADLPTPLGCSGGKVGAGDGGGREKPEGLQASAVWPRSSPCRARRTHFPRRFGRAAESVGTRVGRAAGDSPGGSHSTAKDAAPLRTPPTSGSAGRKLRRSGEKPPPLLAPPPVCA